MAIDGTVSVSFQINDRRTVGLNSAANISVSKSPSTSYTDGAGAAAANQLYHASKTFGGSADSLDMAGGVADGYGGTITFARIKTLYIKNTGNANVTVGGGSNALATFLGATSTLVIRPGGFLLVDAPDATGYAVTAGTGDILTVAGTNGQTYEIAVLGATS